MGLVDAVGGTRSGLEVWGLKFEAWGSVKGLLLHVCIVCPLLVFVVYALFLVHVLDPNTKVA